MMEGWNKTRTKGARQEERVEGRLPCLPRFPSCLAPSGKGIERNQRDAKQVRRDKYQKDGKGSERLHR